MELPIVARGERWVVVNKPPRLLVHRTSGLREPHYALQVVRDQLGCRVNPVHRIDRGASGCLLFAFDGETAAMLHSALRSLEAEKTYLAFTRGQWRPGLGPVVVDHPMKDDHGHLRDAVTEVACVATSAEPRCSLLRARPRTGRFHQVRRHVRDLGHPVLGDGMHGDSRVNRWWRENHGLGRVGLHCLSLDLPLPDGSRLTATAPITEDLAAIWARLPWWDDATAALPALALPPAALPDALRLD